MTRRPNVDFLVVVALKDELDAAIKHFPVIDSSADEYFATVPRTDGGEYRVALVNVGMGPENAQRETRSALQRVRTSRVILIGIGAGFPDAASAVGLGDLMIPQRIVNYESAKIGEEPRKWYQLRRPVAKHRSVPERVTQSLWHSAQTLAEGPEKTWTARITVPRPDGTSRAPTVFVAPETTLGCGAKIIATELYEARRWLLEEFRGIVGLEMESIGVFNACVAADVDFLVIKASQDPATALKDRESEKDLWRRYACDVAAAFAREFVARFRVSNDSLVSEHLTRLKAANRTLLFGESPQFDYRVSLAQSYTDLKRRHFQRSGVELKSLLPNDGAPCVALIGGGGTGKTNISHRLVRELLSDDACPIVFDLSKYAVAAKVELASRDFVGLTRGERERVEKEILERLVIETSVPRHTPAEIEALAKETPILAVVDGLNEIPPNEQALLFSFLRRVGTNERPHIFVTARFGSRDAFAGFAFFSVDLLATADAQRLYDHKHSKDGSGAFIGLHERVREILRRPFFLALAIRGPQLSGLHNVSEIFDRFFDERLGVGQRKLSEIAEAAFAALDAVGGFQVARFKTLVGEKEYRDLVNAEVISRDEIGVDHELWRDFLAAKHLSVQPDLWLDECFDRVTVKASSFECLILTMEQLGEAEQRDGFVKAVYNWNLPAAVECLEFAGANDTGDVTRGLKVAVLAVIAERALDPIAHSRDNARSQLAEQPSDEARRFAAPTNRPDLVAAVQREGVDDPWFVRWFEVFRLAEGEAASDELIELLASGDSILGWAASNALRRAQMSGTQLRRVRDLLSVHSRVQGDNVVRWRIVHCLGTHASMETIEVLARSISEDPHMWVRYGAARSLMEIAALNDNGVRTAALQKVSEALPSLLKLTIIDRQQVLRQIVGSALNSGAVANWATDVKPLLMRAIDIADDADRDELRARVDRLGTLGRSA